MRLRQSVRGLVRSSVRPSVPWYFQTTKNAILEGNNNNAVAGDQVVASFAPTRYLLTKESPKCVSVISSQLYIAASYKSQLYIQLYIPSTIITIITSMDSVKQTIFLHHMTYHVIIHSITWLISQTRISSRDQSRVYSHFFAWTWYYGFYQISDREMTRWLTERKLVLR